MEISFFWLGHSGSEPFNSISYSFIIIMQQQADTHTATNILLLCHNVLETPQERVIIYRDRTYYDPYHIIMFV